MVWKAGAIVEGEKGEIEGRSGAVAPVKGWAATIPVPVIVLNGVLFFFRPGGVITRVTEVAFTFNFFTQSIYCLKHVHISCL
jgi:hypothetical protein